jgi:hypothetical protein
VVDIVAAGAQDDRRDQRRQQRHVRQKRQREAARRRRFARPADQRQRRSAAGDHRLGVGERAPCRRVEQADLFVDRQRIDDPSVFELGDARTGRMGVADELQAASWRRRRGISCL